MENKTQIIPQTEHIQNPLEKWLKENSRPLTQQYMFFFFFLETLFLFNRLAFMITPFPRRRENVRK